MSSLSNLLLGILSWIGVAPTAGELELSVRPAGESRYRCRPAAWGDETVPAPACRRRAPRLAGEDVTVLERRWPRAAAGAASAGSYRRRQSRRGRLEVTAAPRPRGLLT